MGFGRGKGFTTKVRTEMTSFAIRGGGGKAAPIATELAPTYTLKYGGSAGRVTLTELNPTYQAQALAIGIGTPAIDRPTFTPAGYTFIVVDNPANASGKITIVTLWVYSALTACEVAIFYKVDGTTFTTRSNATLGDLAPGLHIISVDMAVEIGDYIGIYFSAGGLDRHDTGGGGYWYYLGDAIPCTAQAFTLSGGRILSLYGMG